MWNWNGKRWVPSDLQVYNPPQPASPSTQAEAETQVLAELRAQTAALRGIRSNVSTLTVLAVLAFISSLIGGVAIGLMIATANKR